MTKGKSIYKKIGFYILFLLFVITTVSCTSSERKKQKHTKKEEPAGMFKMPEIPVTLNSPEARAEYLMAHYWDNFNFSDTSMINKPQISEQAFADFVNIINNIQPVIAEKGITNLMSRAGASSAMLLYFEKLSEKYLYDPNSPVRNEQMFEYFLKSIIHSSIIDETYKIRPAMQLKTVLRNKPGTKATDFSFTLPDGKTSKLSSVHAGLVLLYFNNPECHDCSTVKNKLISSQVIKALTQKGLLKILAVYPDEDIALYKKHQSEMPEEWINAYNKGAVIKNRELYDLKAIPTLYLLDRDKTVLLKDVTFEMLESYLAQKYGNIN